MTRAYIGLGSNLGDREANLAAAIESLDWGDVTVSARSSLYETDPIEAPPGSPDFLNQVIEVETALSAAGLWERCNATEVALGRELRRDEHNAPRTIDIDLLLFGEYLVRDPDLSVPHPRMLDRAFVLVPLVEVAPDVRIPGAGTAREALETIGTDGVRPWRRAR